MANPSSVVLPPFELLTAVSATSAVAYFPQSPVMNCVGSVECTVYVEWGSGVSAGVFVVETASSNSYAGTWSNLATLTYSSGAAITATASISGIYAAVRVRCSTTVQGGTANVWVVTANA